MSLELINDSILVARQLAINLEYRSKSKDSAEIEAAIQTMNKALAAAPSDASGLLYTREVYVDLPDPVQNIEYLDRRPLMTSRIEKAVVSGRILTYRWLGSEGLALFGIQFNGDVDILEPHYLSPMNAFVPVRALEI